MTTRITFHDLSLAVRRLNSIVHPHLVNNQPEVAGWTTQLHETDLIGSFILRPIGRTCYALHRVILHGNVKDTELVFYATGKRAMLDRVNHYADGVQHALLHIPRPSPADAAPYNGHYARYICKNTLTKRSTTDTATCDGCENAYPVDQVDVLGTAEHGLFGLCRACKAKDAAAAADCCPVTGDEYGTQA
jgi:hypothetical protein